MKEIITTSSGSEVEIDLHYSQIFQGRGGWDVKCIVSRLSGPSSVEKNDFSVYTTDSKFIDKISDLRSDDASHEDIQNTYHTKFFDMLKDRISEWCSEGH